MTNHISDSDRRILEAESKKNKRVYKKKEFVDANILKNSLKCSHDTSRNFLEGSFCRSVDKQLIEKPTKTEEEILHLLCDEHLIINQIAKKRKCTPRAIRKHVKNLKEKGLINRIYFTPSQNSMYPRCPPTKGTKHQIRFHAEEFNIKIIQKGDTYRKKSKKRIVMDGNTVRCYRNSIEIYSGKSFFEETAQKATAEANKYWNRFITTLENDLDVILLKDRAQNIEVVKYHYAEIDNELAKEYEIKNIKLEVRTTDDNKLWLLIDNSYNLHETEAVHPDTAKQDIENVTEHFNDIRDNKPPTLSELTKLVTMLAAIVIKNQYPESSEPRKLNKNDIMYG